MEDGSGILADFDSNFDTTAFSSATESIAETVAVEFGEVTRATARAGLIASALCR
ncbi:MULTISPECIES: hypothetical protein [Cryobacterium]|uniref:hypothetical protein n=1 Tax=Cryobacterium TaxID=69578 RepID=UPI00141B6B83|nr:MULTISPECIES: hypothetical protein [Cryobacterium]